jgi:hypothetical protein
MANDNEEVPLDSETESLDSETAIEMSDLKAEMAEMRQSNAALVTQLQQLLKPQPKPEIDDGEIERIKNDPKALAEFIKAKVSEGKQAVDVHLAKNRFDSQAYDEFPALKTNKQFQQSVVAQMKELTASGEYQPDSPKLLLRAAQLSAAKMKPLTNRDEVNDRPTSGEPRPRQSQTVSRGTSQIKDNDPRVAFLKLFGVKDPAKVEKFKKQLGPYQAPQRQKARSLDRGDD